MSKHTPGPWKAEERALNFIDITHSQPDVPGAITHALCRVQARITWVREAKANAKLIAAAPDLLAALQTAEMAMLGYTHRNAVLVKALQDVRAAIVKATD